MVNNQEWFNKEYPKEIKEIELKYEDYKESQGQLVIENYPELEKLRLMDNKGINKVILKNLPQLQECEVWDCEMQCLMVENCPQIKKLDVRNNLLTNLEFLANLENLEKLEIDNNTEVNSGLEYLPKSLKEFSYEDTKLTELLNPYQGDWKTCRSDAKELISQQKYNDLKRSLKGVMVSLSQEAKKELVRELNKEAKRKTSLSASGMWRES